MHCEMPANDIGPNQHTAQICAVSSGPPGCKVVDYRQRVVPRGGHMQRREFITLLGGLAAASPFVARAQPRGKNYRIGFLGVTSRAEYGRHVDALRTGLRQLGYEEGNNIVFEYRWAEGRYDRLPELAAELVNLNIDVLAAHSTPGARAAKQATSIIPIVVAAVADPVDVSPVPAGI